MTNEEFKELKRVEALLKVHKQRKSWNKVCCMALARLVDYALRHNWQGRKKRFVESQARKYQNRSVVENQRVYEGRV